MSGGLPPLFAVRGDAEVGPEVKVWSQGLGRLELEFRLSTVKRGRQLVTIEGCTHKPVVWNLRITVEDGDVLNLIRIAVSRGVITFLLVSVGARLKRILTRR